MKPSWEWKDSLSPDGISIRLASQTLGTTCCRHNTTDRSMPKTVLGPLRKLIYFQQPREVCVIILLHRWGAQGHGSWSVSSGGQHESLLDTNSVLSLLFLAAQMNTKPQKREPKCWTAFKGLVSERPTLSLENLTWNHLRWCWGGGWRVRNSHWGRTGPLPKSDRNLFSYLIYTSNESRTLPALVSDCDCFVFEISVGPFK